MICINFVSTREKFPTVININWAFSILDVSLYNLNHVKPFSVPNKLQLPYGLIKQKTLNPFVRWRKKYLSCLENWERERERNNFVTSLWKKLRRESGPLLLRPFDIFLCKIDICFLLGFFLSFLFNVLSSLIFLSFPSSVWILC